MSARSYTIIRGRTVLVFLLIISIFASGRLQAKPQFLDVAKKTYSIKSGGAIDTASCNLCHAGATNKNSLNPYGKDVQKVLNASQKEDIAPDMLKSLDSKDSDGDGFTNGLEFKSDTLPGDSASKPAGAPDAYGAKPSPTNLEKNPFDVVRMMLDKNAQHPAIIHFPIALFIFSFLLDLLGILQRNFAFTKAGFYNLVAAAITGVLAVATGLTNWLIKYEAAPLKGNLLLHLIFASVTAVLLIALWIIRARLKPDGETAYKLPLFYLILSVLALVLISLTGHIGGMVSGVAG